MAIKKISELDRLTPQDVSQDDVLVINDGDITKQVTLANLFQGTSNIQAVFANTTINGNLTVNGTETVVQRETISVDDNIIVLNSGFTGDNPIVSAGLRINRDLAGDRIFAWDEDNDKWTISDETLEAGSIETFNLSAVDVDITGGSINGVDIGLTTPGNILGNVITADTFFEGDISGSVLSQDSTILVDNQTGVISGTLTGNWSSQENGFEISAPDTTASFGPGFFVGTDNIDLFASGSYDVTADTVNITSNIGITFNGNISVTNGVINSTVNGDLNGSVFGEDSALLIDAINSKIILDSNTTADLQEDSSATVNSGTMYFTAARARESINVVDNGGDGSLTYDTETGVFQFNGPNESEVRSHFSEGIGVNIDTASGEISIGQSVRTVDHVEFASVSADFVGTFRANDSSILIDSENAVFNGDLNGKVSGTLDGELNGSVFGDDSTLLVDGNNGEIVAPVRDLKVNGETGNAPLDTSVVDSWLEITVNGSTKYFPLYV